MDIETKIDKDKPQITLDSTLTPTELRAFNAKLKGILWVVRISTEFKSNTTLTFGTAFSINEDGLVMTSAHLFSEKKGSTVIHARRLHEDDFLYRADLVYLRPKWDIALLKVNDVSKCNFGRLAVDGSLFEGQNVLHIGHSSNFVGSFTVGKVVFPCIDDVNLPVGSQTCLDYQPTSLQITPRYRVMGDIWNSNVFAKHESKPFNYEKRLHPLVPLIQTCGLISGEGSSGGPVFNTKGEVVGMMSMGFMGFEIAIHVSLLKHFLKESEEQMQGGNTKGEVFPNPRSKDGPSKRLKGLA